MRFATRLILLTGAIASGSASAWAGAALDDDKKATPPMPPTPTTDPVVAPNTPVEEPVTYGGDFRLRDVFLPSWMMGLFVERAAGGTSHAGWGFDFIRKRGTVELQFGFEHEQIEPAEGVWIEKGKNVGAGDSADYIVNPTDAGGTFGWYTLEFTFVNNKPINQYVAFRYGVGAGLGILSGNVKRWDLNPCGPGATNSNPTPGCVPIAKGGTGVPSGDNGGAETAPVSYDLGTPVFPVLTALIGVQIKPIEHMIVNVETGIRTLPFIGLSIGYIQ